MPKAQAISTFLSLGSGMRSWSGVRHREQNRNDLAVFKQKDTECRKTGAHDIPGKVGWVSRKEAFLPTRDQGGERRAHLSSWPGVIPFKNIPSCCNPGLGSFWTPMNLEIVPETLARNQEYPSRLPSTSHARTSDEWNLICM